MKKPHSTPILWTLIFLVLFASCSSLPVATSDPKTEADTWTFVSMPDFLNFDIEYPQEGWEDALGFILDSIKQEDPAFVMVAGDLVMGHWGTTKEEIDHWADRYYPPWSQRFRDHDLQVYAGLGDHEIGDNPWRGAKARAVPFYKDAFRRHLKMPLNGPDPMKGTAFYWRHKDALLVAVDVFEPGQGSEGEIVAQVTGEQLAWLKDVLERYRPQVEHIIVMGHTPILRPVRKFSSSGLLLEQGRDSDFWKTLAEYQVDLYLCGEVHAITCKHADGVQQIAHGGLIGRTTKPNYLLVRVHPDRLELELKEIDLVNGTGRLWQHNKIPGPFDTLHITDARKAEGFTSIGSLCIRKQAGTRSFEAALGFFDQYYRPGQ